MIQGESLVIVTLALFNESNSATIAPQVVTASGWNAIPSASALIDRAHQYKDEFQLVAFWQRWNGSKSYTFAAPVAASFWTWAVLAISGGGPAKPSPIRYAGSTVAMPAVLGGTEPTSVGPSPSGGVQRSDDLVVAFMVGNQGQGVGSSTPSGWSTPFVSPGPGYVLSSAEAYVGVELLKTSTTLPLITTLGTSGPSLTASSFS